MKSLDFYIIVKYDISIFSVATRRKISIVKEMPHVKSPSPPASKPTNILLIKNLVRPFTLNQIKELLSRTGTIVENGFWMDRIKSKCIVEVLLYKYKILFNYIQI